MQISTLRIFKRACITSACLSVLFIGIACGSKERQLAMPVTKEKNSGNLQPEGDKNPDGESTSGINVGSPGDLLGDQPLKFIDAVYKIAVKIAGISICEGNVKVEVTVDINNLENGQLLKLPAGWIDCTLVGKIDLTSILGILSPGSKLPKIKVAKNIIFIEEFGNSTYSPPRPFLPSFLAASKKSLTSLKYSNNISITDRKANVSGKGNTSVEMLDFDSTYQSQLLKKKFTKVMHFQTTATGFDNVDKVGNFLFDSLQIKLNLSPVVLISLKTKGKANGLTNFAFENIDKFPKDLQDILRILPSKHNPNNILTPLFGGLADSLAKALEISADLEIAEYDGPTEAPKSKDNGKDKFGDESDEED